MSTPTITLHGTKRSGHAHRVELLLRVLGLSYAFRDALPGFVPMPPSPVPAIA